MKCFMKFSAFLLFSTLSLLCAREITFPEVQESAMKHSQRLTLRSIDVKIEEARLDSIYSTLYPQLSMGYSGEYNHNLDPSVSGSI